MHNKYPRPKELPKVFLDNDGIVNVIYDHIVITSGHIVHSVAEHRKHWPTQKKPVLISGKAAQTDLTEIISVGASSWVSEVTSAMALVTQSKLGNVLGNLFLGLNKNPYPTKLFKDEKSARKWLVEFL